MLSQRNREPRAIFARKKPDSLTELAELAGRGKSNLSRTLTTMSRYRTLDPWDPYDQVSFGTQSKIEKLLKCFFAKHGDDDIEIKKEWNVTKDSQDGYQRENIYSPRVDIAIGPFNIASSNWEDWEGNLCKINEKYNQYKKSILGEIIQKGELLSNGDIYPNQNPRCMAVIEISNHNEMKRMISDIFNASVLGKIGIFVYDQNQKIEKASHRLLNYIRFLRRYGKGFQCSEEIDDKILKNVIFIKSGDIVSVLEKCLMDGP